MELLFLALLILLMAVALGSGYPVAFALPGAAIITIALAAAAGYLFAGDVDAYFFQDGPRQWLSAGVTNLRGVYWEVERDTLIAIPLFIFMGIMLQRSKIAEDLLITMAQLFGPVPGGLGISVVFVGALLAATTGIVGATVVAMGLISLPAMLNNRYSKPLAAGTIAASGTLGQIIPPSIVLIILADQLASATDQASTARKALYRDATGELMMPANFDVTSTSAGEMFLGAMVPGLVLVGLYMLYILVYALLRPSAAPPVHREGALDSDFLFRLGVVLVPPLALIFLVLGSILAGVATVNQAGAIGAAGALLMSSYRLTTGQRGSYAPALLALLAIAVLGYVVLNFDTNIKSSTLRPADQAAIVVAMLSSAVLVLSLVWSAVRAYRIDNTLREVMIETAKATSLVFIILLGAAMLTAAFRAFGGEELVRHFLEALPGGFWSQFITVMLVIFLLGFFLDFIEIAVVVVPIVAPILLADPSANITAVWLGVMIGLNIQTSFLTPPFGFALFYLRGVAPAVVKTIHMYRGVVAFILLQLVALGVVAHYPPLVNYLPNRVSYLSDTAPPPRNPRLQRCLEEYVTARIGSDVDLPAHLRTARALDFTAVPEAYRDGLSAGFDAAEDALGQLAEARRAAVAVDAAGDRYRPLHTAVRDIEAGIRELDERISTLRTTASRLRGAEQTERRERIAEQVAQLEAERDALEATIPSNWESATADFRALIRAEDSARLQYRRAADAAYRSIGELASALSGIEELSALRAELDSVRRQLDAGDIEHGLASLAATQDGLGTALNSGALGSAINSARSALQSIDNAVDDTSADANAALDRAGEAVAAAIEAADAELSWRTAIDAGTRSELLNYAAAVRETLGIRSQARMTREQALYVAACTADHENLSLHF